MTYLQERPWPRRAWLTRNAAALAAVGLPSPLVRSATTRADRRAVTTDPLDRGPAEALAKRAVEAAVAAGASYADARLTRSVTHWHLFDDIGCLFYDIETIGIGVRALVNGYWGAAGSTLWDADEAARLGQEATAVAAVNARGPARAVELGRYPAAVGHWATPVEIDPFTVPLEEKADVMRYWSRYAQRAGCYIQGMQSSLQCTRHERVAATSEGSLFTQTLHETGAVIKVGSVQVNNPNLLLPLTGLEDTGRGWEVFRDAKIPEQLDGMLGRLRADDELNAKALPATIGAYTLVCDGATMAALAERTLGLATQLDRALGYEANASGTSYLNDPLNMVGQQQVASPRVTLTADRSVSGGLATVKWDDEGVVPDTATLVKEGLLTDFQTTRESSAWLKEYYTKVGKPVRSHGHATAQSGVDVPLQQMPNLALTPSSAATSVDDLIGTAKNGVFVANGSVRADFQGKNGMILGDLRQIKNGRLGQKLTGGAVLFSAANFWKNTIAMGGRPTVMTLGRTVYDPQNGGWMNILGLGLSPWRRKGQPGQQTSYSVSAPAALIDPQALIDPRRKA